MTAKALIVFHGNLSDTSQIKKYIDKNSMLIAADGGVSHFLKLGILPDVILGDMDSADLKMVASCENKGSKLIQFPTEKDQIDSQLAIEYAIANNMQEILIFGLLGDRIDHLIANILYLSQISKKIKLTIIENNQAVYFIRNRIEIEGKIGDGLSLVPIKDKAVGITTSGLQYQLNNDNLEFGSTRGVSNVFMAKKVTVSLKKGVLMVIHTALYSLSALLRSSTDRFK